MHLAFAEMVRASTDALRGLGASFGQADDSIDCLMLTHSALGKAYELLREADALRPQEKREAPAIDAAEFETRIDLKGQSLLLMAARIADYAATVPGGTVIRVENGPGRWALPYLMHRLASHGVAAAARWDELHLSENFVVVGVPQETGPIVHFLNEQAAWTKAMERLSLSAAAYSAPAPAAGALLVVAGLRSKDCPPASSAAGLGGQTIDFSNARHSAIATGFEVEPADHAFFQHLISRIRVPTTERSRSQAG